MEQEKSDLLKIGILTQPINANDPKSAAPD